MFAVKHLLNSEVENQEQTELANRNEMSVTEQI